MLMTYQEHGVTHLLYMNEKTKELNALSHMQEDPQCIIKELKGVHKKKLLENTRNFKRRDT